MSTTSSLPGPLLTQGQQSQLTIERARSTDKVDAHMADSLHSVVDAPAARAHAPRAGHEAPVDDEVARDAHEPVVGAVGRFWPEGRS